MSRIYSNLRPWRLLVLLTIVSVTVLLYIQSSPGKTEGQDSSPEQKKVVTNITLGKSSDVSKNISDDNPVIAPSEKTFSEPTRISLEPLSVWIDLPNAFPWRQCLVDYNGKVAATDCIVKQTHFVMEYSAGETEDRFLWRTTTGHCVTPGKESLMVRQGCDETKDSYWVWTELGQLQWSKNPCVECRKCVSGRKKGEAMGMAFCEQYAEDQNLELGRWKTQEGGKSVLRPLNVGRWERRQSRMREEILRVESGVVRNALEEIDMDMALHEYDKEVAGQRRRAAVFYVDRGASGLAMVKWWLYTWKWIGLDTAEQGFDLVMMTHPAMVERLPPECVRVEDNFRNLAKLTLALNKYGRAQMFGPGTTCRCATCDKLPKVCEWGSGPYAGTLLLYLQEIALNKILTQENWDNMPKGQLDQGVTDFKRNVCEPVVLHCFHNGELFSKNAFSAGNYKNMDMSELNMTNERDYAAYLALVSSGQGRNSDKALDNLKQSMGNQTWTQYCNSRSKS